MDRFLLMKTSRCRSNDPYKTTVKVPALPTTDPVVKFSHVCGCSAIRRLVTLSPPFFNIIIADQVGLGATNEEWY